MEDFILESRMKFDVVHLKNVLEHVLSPEQTLKHCMMLLNNSGVIYTEVPNDYQFIQKLELGAQRTKILDFGS